MKKLHRSRNDRQLLGVAGGMGQMFGVDSNLVRLVWCALGLLWGYGILLYLIAAAILPVEAADEDTVTPTKPKPRKRSRSGGPAAAAAGA